MFAKKQYTKSRELENYNFQLRSRRGTPYVIFVHRGGSGGRSAGRAERFNECGQTSVEGLGTSPSRKRSGESDRLPLLSKVVGRAPSTRHFRTADAARNRGVGQRIRPMM